MEFSVEKAMPADAGAIIAYLKQVGGETDNLTFGAEGLPFTEAMEEEYIAGIENSHDEIMFLAKANDRIIGDASLSRLPRRMGHRGDFSVSVLKEYWHCGVGSALLGRIIEFAKENAFEIIDLQVRADNLRAIRLYEKYGFEKLCLYPNFFKIDDRYVDFCYMRLELK